MTTPHTPGPWKTVNGVQLAGQKHLAYIQEAPGLKSSAELNQRLRDAAPDMLAALTFIRDFMGNVDHSSGGGENTARLYGGMLMSIKKIAEKTIAKAEGTQ